MKKLRSLSLLILVLLSNIVMAQYIRVLPVSTDNIGNNVAEMLHDRLNQAVSLNGMASTDNSNKFLLIPSVTVTSVEPTTTTPVQYTTVQQHYFYVNSRGDLQSPATEVMSKVNKFLLHSFNRLFAIARKAINFK